MRQVVRAKIVLSHEVAERLAQAGIHVKGRPADSADGRRPASFIVEVDAPSETDAPRTVAARWRAGVRFRWSRSGAAGGS